MVCTPIPTNLQLYTIYYIITILHLFWLVINASLNDRPRPLYIIYIITINIIIMIYTDRSKISNTVCIISVKNRNNEIFLLFFSSKLLTVLFGFFFISPGNLYNTAWCLNPYKNYKTSMIFYTRICILCVYAIYRSDL